MLYVCHVGIGGFFEESVEVAGEVALEEPDGVAGCLALADAAGDVVAGRRVVVAAMQDDGVEGPVELAIAATAAVMLKRPGFLGGSSTYTTPYFRGRPARPRIVGLLGELVSERDGVVYVDGDLLVEPYVDPTLRGHETGRWPRVARGQYLVLGDNRIRSCDSRTWGTVPRGDLIGPVLLTYWPRGRGSFR